MLVFYKNNVVEAANKKGYYQALTNKEISFYMSNPNATVEEIKNLSLNVSDITNEEIRERRKIRYSSESDHYFVAFKKNLELGNDLKAAEYKIKWITAVAKIEEELPYIKD